ncbi:MAG: mitochondrial fission ELM1 family protein [Alphaproteobacteria bacterium]|nr:mitochondrial fission ELM1 family protein [Alphaproteobacteria bacterium]
MTISAKKIWIVTEGLVGTENQCLGVAEALARQLPDSVTIPFRIKLREPWKTLSPWLGLEQWWSFDPLLEPPWPDILITSGRKAIASARFIKKTSGGKTFALHIQDPRIKPGMFDVVAVPAHDRLRGNNVIVTTASPNRITPARLEEARTAFANLASLPEPRVAVLIGGTSKTHRITPAIAERLLKQLEDISQTASLMITTSRRTPDSLKTALQNKFSGSRHFVWDGTDPNPYFGFLAHADAIITTNDSASMLSEAATTGKPVYTVKLEGGSAKFDKLYATLEKTGALREFTGTLESWSYKPLNDAETVAKAVIERYKKHHETR